MMFRPELAAKVLAGEKTVTRRKSSVNQRSPWYVGRCRLVVGCDYAICPGRGLHQVGRVVIDSVRLERLGVLSEHEARLEGFASAADFDDAWRAINGRYEPATYVWRIEFHVLAGADNAA